MKWNPFSKEPATEPEEIVPIFVIALNYQRFKWFCQDKGVNPVNGPYIYLHSARQVYGYKKVKLIYLSGWYEKPGKDLDEILEIAAHLRNADMLDGEPINYVT